MGIARNLIQRLMGTPEAAEPAPSGASASEAMKKADQQVRETAKWLITSFAAIGAILLGGIQLSSLGNLTGQVPDERVIAAIAGIALGVAGIAVAILFTSSVLAPPLNTFASADKEPDVTRDVLGNREIVGHTYEELKSEIGAADCKIRAASTDAEYKLAMAERGAWEPSKEVALDAIASELLFRRFKTARTAVLVGILLAAAGLALFAWGANPPKSERESAPVALRQAPLRLAVHLTPHGREALQKARGCSTSDMTVLAIGGKEGEREVVTLPSSRCKSVRFILTPVIGTPIAAEGAS